MNDREPVEFVGEAASVVPDKEKPHFAAEIGEVFAAFLPENDPPQAITVRRCFTSFTLDLGRRAVFGVEVRTKNQYQTHIVKLGDENEVRADSDNWLACTSKGVASRIFAPVVPVKLAEENRFAVVYQDGYTLFGPNREDDQPRTLDVVSEWMVNDHKPTLASVERAVSHVYADLGRWFYAPAEVDADAAMKFYRRILKCDPPPEPRPKTSKPSEPVLKLWADNPERELLRRDVVWVLSGRDKPDGDPAELRYLDPIEYVHWALAAEDGSRLPKTLVGMSHGDLHARNILMGIRRGEAEYPVVFDYGEMRTNNVLAWDFAKLECELIRRRLPALLADSTIQEALAQASKLRPKAIADVTGVSFAEKLAAAQRRKSADRMRATLAFHEMLHQLTTQIESRSDAENYNGSVSATGIPRLDRLLALLLRIRSEAAFWLGFERPGRKALWRDELYFAHAIHGLLNVRWDYDRPEMEVALIGAGVAVARLQTTPTVLRAAANVGWSLANAPFPSYWVPLAITHRLWSDRRYPEADQFLQREKVAAPGSSSQIIINPPYRHAVPLIGEVLLIQMEIGKIGAVEEQLDKDFRPLAREFGDYEMLGRIGPLFKDAGDRKWEEAKGSFDDLRGTGAWQMYKKACTIYHDAYCATDDYYVGINAASLALLTHDPVLATQIAKRVADQCAAQHDHAKGDRYWLFATEGEAALIRGKPHENGIPDALDFYRDALAELSEGQGGKANSSYKQLRRLRWALGEVRVGPILELFEKSPFRGSLSLGYLNRQNSENTK